MGRKETHIIFEEKFCYFGYMPSVTICVKKKERNGEPGHEENTPPKD